MVRKSYLQQHLYKEQENRGILDFAAQAKLLIEENLMGYFFQMMSATHLHQNAATEETPDLETPDEPYRQNLEAQPPTAGLSISIPPALEQPTSTQRNIRSSKRSRKLSAAGRDPKQRRLDTMFQ